MQLFPVRILTKSISASYILFAMYLCPFLLSGYLSIDIIYMCALYVCLCEEPVKTGYVCLCALTSNPTAFMYLCVCMHVRGCTQASV